MGDPLIRYATEAIREATEMIKDLRDERDALKAELKRYKGSGFVVCPKCAGSIEIEEYWEPYSERPSHEMVCYGTCHQKYYSDGIPKS